jgi:hypothetical protein
MKRLTLSSPSGGGQELGASRQRKKIQPTSHTQRASYGDPFLHRRRLRVSECLSTCTPAVAATSTAQTRPLPARAGNASRVDRSAWANGRFGD